MGTLSFCHDYEPLSYPESDLIKVAASIFKKENVKKSTSITVILCSDYTIRKLNKQFRKKDKATDVLSFPITSDDGFLGEIYISLQRCAVQAKDYGWSYNEEISRMLVHGIFHLLGYDHLKKTERAAMEAKERLYCSF